MTVQSNPIGNGRIVVNIRSTPRSDGQANQITGFRIGSATSNVRFKQGGRELTVGQLIDLTSSPTPDRVGFEVERIAPGAVSVSYTVIDTRGDYSSYFGGGANAF